MIPQTVYQKTVPAPIFALLMELTSLDVSAGQAGGAASAPTGSLANIDDDDEPAAIEASTAPTTTGDSEDSSPSASGEWEDVEERS
jgi:import receptor subunit TOM20